MQLKYSPFIVLLLLFTSVNGKSQNTKVYRYALDWNLTEDNPTQKPYLTFKGGILSDINPDIDLYPIESELGRNSIVKSEIRPLRTQIFETSLISDKNLTDYYLHTTDVIEIRKQYQIKSFVLPVRKIGAGKYELLLEFEITFTEETLDAAGLRGPLNKTRSVLADGDIYKIAIEKTGIHRIDRNFLESRLGMNVTSIDPRNIKIYGAGGGMLPEANAAMRIDDLEELHIYVEGAQDGRFDNNDFILFYAEGPDKWQYNKNQNDYVFQKNIYDTKNYYFLKISPEPGLRILSENEISEIPEKEFDVYDFTQRFEVDRVNLLGAQSGTYGTGKEWYGDSFRTTRERNYSSEFDFTATDLASDIDLKMVFAGRSANGGSVTLTIGDRTITRTFGGVVINNIEATYAAKVTINEKLKINTSPSVTLRLNTTSADSDGWLDFIQIVNKRTISMGTTQRTFRNAESINLQTAALVLQGYNNHQIWDITDHLAPKIVKPIGNKLIFRPAGENRNFISFVPGTDMLTPTGMGKISNQNLHGTENAQMLVVYFPAFKDAAERFAQHRQSHSGIRVVATEISQVYNEFSSGKTDPTAIRDYVRMLYSRDPNFKYLLLLGDGTYDYRNIMPNLSYENFIPVYQTDQSLNPISGFPSDDYFALLGESEGTGLRGGLDIYVGRLPVKTASEANDVVSKIIHYDLSPATYGDWRLRTGFAADDEDNGLHVRDMDEIARSNEVNDPKFNQQKVYFDAFRQVSTAGENRYPDANRLLTGNLFKGQLTLTYLGHGGFNGWAQERVLTVPDIQRMENFNQLVLMVTATCSFAAYDDPAITSPAEFALLNPKGGAIALFSTTRPVFTSSNKQLTAAVHDLLYRKVDGNAPAFGYILSASKNRYPGDFFIENSRKFTLIGDPSQQIALPKYDIVTTNINGRITTQDTDTLRALSKVTFEGYIAGTDGNILENFNGTIFPTLFDKKSRVQTLGNDRDSPVFPFEVFRNIIFKGSASVVNGRWTFSFWVPKDINYAIGKGRLSLYATDGNTTDAGGVFSGFSVGGTSESLLADDKGPEIELFMNDENFVFGGMTNSSPVLLANLRDDYGINVTGNAIGHDITAILDDDNQNILILNDFYESAKDDYTSGKVQYPLKALSKGKHSLTLKAWDIANNSSEARTEFLVVDSENEVLKHVLNYPNPFTTNTQFSFEHDLPNTELSISINIYTISGRLVKTISDTRFTTGFRVTGLYWNGRDDYESKLAKGVYLYKVAARSKDMNIVRESGFEKLIIL